MSSKLAEVKAQRKAPKAGRDENYEKYLTEMKELGDTQPVLDDDKKPKQESSEINSKMTPQAQKSSVQTEKQPITKEPKAEISAEEKIQNPTLDTKFYTKTDIVLLLVNLASLVSLFFLLYKIPILVADFKKLENELNTMSENPELGNVQIDQNRSKLEKINSSFLEKTNIVNFVNDIETIKTEGTSISKVTFTSETPVRDKTGNLGYPVVIEFSGNWDRISEDLYEIEKLQYLFRPVRLESQKSLTEEGVILLRYGGILYVKDLGKN